MWHNLLARVRSCERRDLYGHRPQRYLRCIVFNVDAALGMKKASIRLPGFMIGFILVGFDL